VEDSFSYSRLTIDDSRLLFILHPSAFILT